MALALAADRDGFGAMASVDLACDGMRLAAASCVDGCGAELGIAKDRAASIILPMADGFRGAPQYESRSAAAPSGSGKSGPRSMQRMNEV